MLSRHAGYRHSDASFSEDGILSLHSALPVSIETERQKWESLNQVMVYGNNLEPLVYEDKPK